MGKTSIEWTDYSFNPWVGCTRVSPACDHCYAEGWARRTGQPQLWQGERRRTTETYWQQPLKWNRQAEREGRRARVFCASLADVFDNQVPNEWRTDLWHLIVATPHLDWLLLTKRPQNIAKMLPDPRIASWCWPWPNVWLGTTVENQAEADRRIPHLLSIPAAVHFLSCEPLLGPVDLRESLGLMWHMKSTFYADLGEMGPISGRWAPSYNIRTGAAIKPAIDWVIAGGESGTKARPSHPDWFRRLRDQCAAAEVPFHFKQWGEWAPASVALPSDHLPEDADCMVRVGKHRVGRLLDGIEHNGVPEPRDA